MSQSGKVIDLRKGSPRDQAPLFSLRTSREPESPKRPTPLRVRRRKARAVAAFVVLLIIASVLWGMSWVSYLPRFSIGSISVTGTQQVPERLIQNYVETIINDGSYHVFSRSNMFLYPRSGIEKAVEIFFPRIKSAKISRESLLATAMTVAVEERRPFARWCLPAQAGADSLTRCYVMDEGGFIFAEEPNSSSVLSPKTQYVFRGSLPAQAGSPQANPIGQRFAPAHLPGLLALLEFLGQAGFDPQGGTIDNDRDFLIPLIMDLPLPTGRQVPGRQEFILKVSFGQDVNALIKNLQLVLSSDPLKGKESQLEYVDLRFDNRVYYKLFSEGESAFGGKGEAEVSGAAE